MQKFKVVDNGNPDGTAKNALAGISPGTNYKAEVWNDNLFNLFKFVENQGYTLIDDDISQLTKALKGKYDSLFTYNTSAVVTQSVNDIVLGSDGIYYEVQNDAVIGENPVGSTNGDWKIKTFTVSLAPIETMEDLILLKSPTNKTSINLQGYTVINDGGGGVFNYDSTIDKSTANGGTIIDPDQTLANQGNGVGSGCWLRQYSGAINILWFGAKDSLIAGNESFDSTSAISNAITSAISGVNKIFIPTGIFRVSQLIITPLKRGFTIEGTSKRASIIKLTLAGGLFEINQNDKYSDYVNLRNFGIDGNGVAKSVIIRTNYTEAISILTLNFNDYGLFVEGLVCSFKDCMFLRGIGEGNGAVIRTGWNATVFTECYANAEKVGFDDTVVVQVQQTDNSLECVNHIFSNNTFEKGIINISSASSVNFHDNYLEEIEININGADTGHATFTKVDNIRIENNHSVEAAPSIILTELDRTSNFSIKGNDIDFGITLDVKGHNGLVEEKLDFLLFPNIDISSMSRRADAILINGNVQCSSFSCEAVPINLNYGFRRVKIGGLFVLTTDDTPQRILQIGYNTASGVVAQGCSIKENTTMSRLAGVSSKYFTVFNALGSAEYTDDYKNAWRTIQYERNPRVVDVAYATVDATKSTDISVVGEATLSNQWSMDLELIMGL